MYIYILWILWTKYYKLKIYIEKNIKKKTLKEFLTNDLSQDYSYNNNKIK